MAQRTERPNPGGEDTSLHLLVFGTGVGEIRLNGGQVRKLWAQARAAAAKFGTLLTWAGASAMTIALSFAANVIVARAYSISDAGAFFLALLLAQLLAAGTGTATGSNALKVLTQLGEEERGPMAASLLRTTALLASVWLLASLLVLWGVSETTPLIGGSVLVAGLVAGAVQALYAALQNARLTSGHKREVARSLAIAEVLRLVFAVTAVALGAGVEWQVYALALSRAAVAAWVLSRAPSLIGRSAPWSAIRPTLLDGLHLQGAQLAALAAVRLFEGAIVAFKGVVELGLFGVAAQIPGQLQRVFEWFRPLLSQTLVESRSDLSVDALRIGGLLALVGGALTAPLVLGAPEIVKLIYGSKYVIAAPAFAVMALGAVGTIQSYFFSLSLVAAGHPRRVVLGPLSLASVGLPACALLVPAFGAAGAAVALLAGQFASATANTISLSGAKTALRAQVLADLWGGTIVLGLLLLLALQFDLDVLSRAALALVATAAMGVLAWRRRAALRSLSTY